MLSHSSALAERRPTQNVALEHRRRSPRRPERAFVRALRLLRLERAGRGERSLTRCGALGPLPLDDEAADVGLDARERRHRARRIQNTPSSVRDPGLYLIDGSNQKPDS